MSDTMARRVNLYDCTDQSGIYEFDRNGTHMLVGVEAWRLHGWSVGTHMLVDAEKWAAKNAEIERLRERIEGLVAALPEIAKGKGAFDRDQLKHASNVIEETIDIALRALEGK
jgi:hypothetical protein